MSLCEILFLAYFLVGGILSWYWRNENYAKKYEEARNSEEGVEEGMAAMLICILFIFWPIVLIYKLGKKLWKRK